MPISPSLRGLSQAVRPPLSPDDPTQQFDQAQQARYATEDADPNLNKGPGFPSSYSNTANRIQDSAAVGPMGYNRPMVPFIQSLTDKRVRSLGGQDDFGAMPQEGPFGTFGAGTDGTAPYVAPSLAGLKTALVNKK